MGKRERGLVIHCYWCGVLCYGTATRDHYIPQSKGGVRWIYSCRLCNQVKGDMYPEDFKNTLYYKIYCEHKARKGKTEAECNYPPVNWKMDEAIRRTGRWE